MVFIGLSTSQQKGTMACPIANHPELSIGLEAFEIGLHGMTMCDREFRAASARTLSSNPPPAPAIDTAGSVRAAADTASPFLPVPRSRRPPPPAYPPRPPARDWRAARMSISRPAP